MYDRGLVRVAWAARQMGISFEQLVAAARDGGISVAGGIDWADLIPLAQKLLVRERDPARRALIRNGLTIFIRTRSEATTPEA